MEFFFNLEPLHLHPSVKPFPGLRNVQWKAQQILKRNERTSEQIDGAAVVIRSLIDEIAAQRTIDELESHVRYLYERGGWELSFLDGFENDRQPTMEEIRSLLENWPSWADDRPSLPRPEDFDDLDLLQDILSSGYPYDDIPEFPEASEFECYAVLALMKLDAVVSLLQIPSKPIPPNSSIHYDSPLTSRTAIAAGNLIVEATEIICYAERELFWSQMNELRAKHEREKQEQAVLERQVQERQARIENAEKIANIRWNEDAHKRDQAKALIKHYLTLWEVDRSLYKNQGEFARDMEEKVEMQVGRNKHQKLIYSASTIEVRLISLLRKS